MNLKTINERGLMYLVFFWGGGGHGVHVVTAFFGD
jgi:hypothetical protein